ncbi:MAG: lysophospholipid acyltransferase family protein [Chloroflexota bacterium]
MRQFVSKFIRFVIRLIARVEVRGFENLPKTGGYVLASNHLGRLDTAMLFYALDGDFILPVAEKYERHWLFGPLGNALGAIWLDRFNADVGSIREMFARMKAGGILVIAPEGTRSKTESLAEGKPGVAYLAMKAGVPIVPIALAGTEDRVVAGNLKRFRKTKITVTAGPAFSLPPVKGKDRDEALKGYTDEIMCRIGALLPEKYRGVYADHPRMKELLA